MAWAGGESAFQGFVDKHALTFPQISDRSGKVFDRFEVPVQPAIVVVGADGSVQQLYGALDQDDLDATLTAMTTTDG